MQIMNKTTESYVDVVFGSVELTSAIFGILLNTITLPYFTKRLRSISNILYTLIVITDILSSLTCIPSAISMLNDREPVLLGNKVLCSVTGYIFNITSRMSVFLISVLSVARSISISLPFKKPHMVCYIAPLLIYLIMNILLASLPLIASDEGYFFERFGGYCSWGLTKLSFIELNSLTYLIFVYSSIILPWLVPGLVVSISSIVSIYFLIGHRKLLCKNGKCGQIDKHARSATVTILIMTCVYIIFNTPCWLLYFSILTNKLAPRSWLRKNNVGLFLNIFVSRISVVMNAATNPLVYFTRMKGLRVSLSKKGHDARHSIISHTNRHTYHRVSSRLFKKSVV